MDTILTASIVSHFSFYKVSVWATQNRPVLRQQQAGSQLNEIKAIPKLLEQLDITGAVVILDAMGCQTRIAERLIAKRSTICGHRRT